MKDSSARKISQTHNDDGNIKFRSCTGKISYGSLHSALWYAAYYSNHQKTFDAYKCLYYCGGYHLTRKLMTQEQLKNNFTYHPPKDNQPERYTVLRQKAYELALMINELVPDSREKSLAFTNLEQTVFWANGAISRNE